MNIVAIFGGLMSSFAKAHKLQGRLTAISMEILDISREIAAMGCDKEADTSDLQVVQKELEKEKGILETQLALVNENKKAFEGKKDAAAASIAPDFGGGGGSLGSGEGMMA